MSATFERTTALTATPAEVFDWHCRPGAFLRLAPPWQRIELAGGHPRVDDGARVTLRMWKGPIAIRWTAEHLSVRPGRGFQDLQVRGPFAHWLHTHDFAPRPDGGDGP